MTSKFRSAHKQGKGGQKVGSRPILKKSSQFESVVFVPSTPGSILQKELQKGEDNFTRGKGIKCAKFVKRGGHI